MYCFPSVLAISLLACILLVVELVLCYKVMQFLRFEEIYSSLFVVSCGIWEYISSRKKQQRAVSLPHWFPGIPIIIKGLEKTHKQSEEDQDSSNDQGGRVSVMRCDERSRRWKFVSVLHHFQNISHMHHHHQIPLYLPPQKQAQTHTLFVRFCFFPKNACNSTTRHNYLFIFAKFPLCKQN